jgi:hypothetical protein
MPDLLKGWLSINAPKTASVKQEEGKGESIAATPGPEPQALVVQAINDIISR